MKICAIVVAIILATTALSFGQAPNVMMTCPEQNDQHISLAFTENQGQWDDQVLYRADAGAVAMWFTTDGAVYQFTCRLPGEDADSDESTSPMHDRFDTERGIPESIIIKANFIVSNPNPRMVGLEEMEYKCNYFIGNDPAKWRTNVSNYRAAIYEGIYDGIDLKYYSNGKQMEYDFIVSPGADPSQIAIQYKGTKSLSVNTDGELVVETDWGRVIEHRPLVYQESDGIRTAIGCEYVLLDDNTFGFYLSSGYNAEYALVIDPVLSFSTYLGG